MLTPSTSLPSISAVNLRPLSSSLSLSSTILRTNTRNLHYTQRHYCSTKLSGLGEGLGSSSTSKSKSRLRCSTLSKNPTGAIKPYYTHSTYSTKRTLSYDTRIGPYTPRTHTCGELNAKHVDQRVSLCGWLTHNRKISKNLGFFVLGDSHGQTQLLAKAPKRNIATEDGKDGDIRNARDNTLRILDSAPLQSVIQITGVVKRRIPSAVTSDPTGEIEVIVEDARILNRAAEQLPFSPTDEINLPNEEYRLRHRHLDLRRPKLSSNIKKRSEIAHIVRNFLHSKDFVEVETPMLLRSTPEGAREFLVPTRILDTTSTTNTKTTATSTNGTNGTTGNEVNISSPMFYALSQSPQQPKQILMCSGGIERYYQFARCFRDEDGRADRQPEFTQIDMEMAFVSWGAPSLTNPSTSTSTPTLTSTLITNSTPAPAPAPTSTSASISRSWNIGGPEVRDVVEGIMRKIWENVWPSAGELAFPVMRYEDAMNKYGSDKPDLRWSKELVNITSHLPQQAQEELAQKGLAVEALILPAVECPLNEHRETLKKHLSSEVGLYQVGDEHRWIPQTPEQATTTPSQPYTNSYQDLFASTKSVQVPGLNEGDALFVSIRPAKPEGGWTALGRLRAALISHFAKENWNRHRFLWVTEFPLFTRADEDKEFLARGRWSSSHHPFTAPMLEDLRLLQASKEEKLKSREDIDNDLSRIRGQHYDLVLNGVEIAGGSVRIHDADLQEYIMEHVLELSPNERAGFADLLQALRSGAPPHGGIAIGFDRLMSIICNERSIRNVIAFPKTAGGVDLLFKSPAPVSKETLATYGLQPTQK